MFLVQHIKAVKWL